MFRKRTTRRVPALNTTSTADISFMLLILFLVTTSMNIDKGLKRQLPPQLPPEEQINEKDIEKENIFNIDITANNELLSNGKPTSLQQLKQELPKFIQRNKTSHVIRINADKDSQYEQYFRLQNIIMLTYRQLRNDYLKQKYNTTLVTSNEEQIEEAREYYPQRISEDIIQEEGDNK